LPRFSVLTPTRDRRPWIRRCVQSLLNQTCGDWEQIILDVGQDTVEDLIPADPRIRYVRGECHGPAADFQAALDLATGDIVHPLSDDDRLTLRALETVDREIGDHAWLNARTVLVNPDGIPVALRGGTRDHVERTRHGQYMLGGAIYWKRTLTDELGGFDSAYDGAADFDLYSRFLRHSEPRRLRDVLYLYTDHDGTDSRMNQERQADATNRIVVDTRTGTRVSA
jgi:glycosyltransferase involved in cell wall biosynthesis